MACHSLMNIERFIVSSSNCEVSKTRIIDGLGQKVVTFLRVYFKFALGFVHVDVVQILEVLSIEATKN